MEDRLSDALHEQLTQRFIDRRTSVLMKHLRDDEFASLALDESGGVSIGGEAIGKLDGFRFVPDPRADRHPWPHLARRGAEGPGRRDSLARSAALAAANDAAITLSEHGKLWWDGAIVGQAGAGASPLSPSHRRCWRMSMLKSAHERCRRACETG